MIRLLAQKILLNARIDLRWLFFAPWPLTGRLRYLFAKYAAIVGGRRKVNFLGRDFVYDNIFTPALLPDYLFEVHTLARVIPFAHLTSLLDIGANVGQFAFVAKTLNPLLEVYSFEPNREIVPLLEKNAAQFPAWSVFGFAPGAADGRAELFFVEGKSGQGSLYPNNAVAGLLRTNPRRVEIAVRALDPAILNIPVHYGLVKIDVEGAERQTLGALGRVGWDYLYIELSEEREGGLSLDETLAVLGKSADCVLYRSGPAGDSATMHVILHNLGR